MIKMHPGVAELIYAVICAIAIIRFWRMIALLVIFAILSAIVLGVATMAIYFVH